MLKLRNLISSFKSKFTRQSPETTILFADVSQSTKMFETYGDVRAHQIVAHVLMILTETVIAYQGQVIKTIGDEVMATFQDIRTAINASIKMQKLITEDTKLSQLNVGIKIGFHAGWVLEEKGDVYGDNVNVAARVVSMANTHQVFTTRNSLSHLQNFSGVSTRSQGFVHIKGKRDKVEIVEIIWQHDLSDITTKTRISKPLQVRAPLQVLLFHDGQLHSMKGKHFTLTMGREKTNDLAVNENMISRSHVSIEIRHYRCILTDKSTNGTYVGIDNSNEVLYIHRDEIQLQGSGVISMGVEIKPTDPRLVYYKCE